MLSTKYVRKNSTFCLSLTKANDVSLHLSSNMPIEAYTDIDPPQQATGQLGQVEHSVGSVQTFAVQIKYF